MLQEISSKSGPPWECAEPLGLAARTPRGGPGPPRVHARPLGWGPDPSTRGPDRSQQGPRVLGQKILKPWSKTKQGPVTCLDPILYASAPRPSEDPMLPRGPLPVT
jgi:hypothetical protein